jgi:hypothetical protein
VSLQFIPGFFFPHNQILPYQAQTPLKYILRLPPFLTTLTPTLPTSLPPNKPQT